MYSEIDENILPQCSLSNAILTKIHLTNKPFILPLIFKLERFLFVFVITKPLDASPVTPSKPDYSFGSIVSAEIFLS